MGGVMGLTNIGDFARMLASAEGPLGNLGRIYLCREQYGNYAWKVTPSGLELLSTSAQEEEEPYLDWGPDSSPVARERVARILYGQVVSSRYDSDFEEKISQLKALVEMLPEEVKRSQKAQLEKISDPPRQYWERKMHDMTVMALAESIILQQVEDRWSIDASEIVAWIINSKGEDRGSREGSE